MTDAARDQLPTALLRPDAYPEAPGEVGFLETHISWLFFAGERVYKVKKPVDLGFLDFTTISARRHFCIEEVRLNERLAAGVYHGVRPIQRGSDGRLRVGGEDDASSEVVDWAVEMERLPAAGMLEARLAIADVDNDLMRRLASLLVGFHATAATGEGIDEHGSPAAVAANARENFATAAAFVGVCLSPALLAFLRERAEAFLEARSALLARRVAEHRIREGHGDLHAGNICVLGERIVVYDCIEFAERFRCADVAADLAFLLMDLDRRCFRGFSGYLARTYAVESDDAEIGRLLGFYKGYRAMVRGKVTALRMDQMGGGERETARSEAMAYFHLAASYELEPALILCCGLPGSGKSHAAAHVARPFEAARLNSDTTRKRMAGMPATQSARAEVGRGIYSESRSDATYAELLREAGGLLGRGRTVIVDAGFRTSARRAPFHDLAERMGLACVVLHVDPPEAVVLERLRKRVEGSAAGSDADEGIYRAVRAEFEAPDGAGGHGHGAVVRTDGVEPMCDVVAAVIDALIGWRGLED